MYKNNCKFNETLKEILKYKKIFMKMNYIYNQYSKYQLTER